MFTPIRSLLNMGPGPSWVCSQHDSKHDGIHDVQEFLLCESIFKEVHLRSDWLIWNFFTPLSRLYYSYGEVTKAGEGLQNLHLCTTLLASGQGAIFTLLAFEYNCGGCYNLPFTGLLHLLLNTIKFGKSLWISILKGFCRDYGLYRPKL
jgi:hypothetical protein